MTVSQDEGIRPGTTQEVLAGLRPAFEEGGTVTAGNASQISDGAAAMLVTTSEVAAAHGWRPLARVHAVALAAVDPVLMLTGPIPATRRVLQRAGLDLADIDTFEVNEAFASVPLAWLAETGADPARLNPRRRGDRPRPPARWLRCAAHRHAAAPDAAHRRALRVADDVRGRRDGQRDGAGTVVRSGPGAGTIWCPAPGIRPLQWSRLLSPSRVGTV